LVLVFFVKGIVVGAIIAVPVGPVGILCLRKAIFDGRLAGLAAGLGAATADAFFGAIAAFGLTFISQWLLGYQGALRAAGGCYLVYAGARAFFSLPPEPSADQSDAESLARDFFSTFALTITNPITILVFLSIFDVLGLSGGRATLLYAGVLVIGVWTGSLLWWLGLSLGVGMYRGAIEPRELDWISRGSGMILFLSGAGLLAFSVFMQLVHLV
jgi:threonine/homoserine/homoserine lactone efflux protein